MKPINLLLAKNRKLALKLYLVNSVIPKKPKRRFCLDKITDQDSLRLFRFSKDQLKKIRIALGLPRKVICRFNTVCSGIEALCVLLRRLCYPNRLFDLTFLFKRNASQIGEIFNHVIHFIWEKFGHLLTDIGQPWLTKQCMDEFADAITKKGAPLKKCWGFIDGTVRPMCRPNKFQKEVYNGHKRVHSLKYQAVTAPNGLIVNLYGPIEGRRHDSFMLSESKLLPKLERLNQGEVEPYCIYGDPAYPLRPELQAPYKGSRLSQQQLRFNKKMSMNRIAVEWSFGKVLSLFAFLDYKKNQKLFLQPLAKYFKVAVIMTNIHTCLNGSQVSDFFDFETLTLTEYLQ